MGNSYSKNSLKRGPSYPNELYSNNEVKGPSSSFTMGKECQICFESCSTNLFVKITEGCSHKLDVCKLCVNNHIKARLDSKGDVEINCPYPGCKQEFQHNDVKKIANKELFERFD